MLGHKTTQKYKTWRKFGKTVVSIIKTKFVGIRGLQVLLALGRGNKFVYAFHKLIM